MKPQYEMSRYFTEGKHTVESMQTEHHCSTTEEPLSPVDHQCPTVSDNLFMCSTMHRQLDTCCCPHLSAWP